MTTGKTIDLTRRTSVSKVMCFLICIVLMSNVEKNICPLLLLESPRPLSPSQGPWTPYQPFNLYLFIRVNLITMLFFPLKFPNFVHILPYEYVFIVDIFSHIDYFRVFNIPPLVMKVHVIYLYPSLYTLIPIS